MAVIESDLNDIQFLGNWNSQQPSSPSSFVSAIVLTPESSPSEVPRTFSRIQTSVVHVGRTPATESSLPTDDRATFSNPVMSRNHAKITFADSGSVFVIDTNSHHGTWVARSPAEFKLAGESPFQLQDGDRLTFGKEVQRNGILHSPLTVTIKLLQSASTPSSMSISSSSVSPASKYASPRPRNRFGLDSSSDSDPSDNEDSNGDSREDSRESDPCTGPNAIPVDLPCHRPDSGNSILGSPKSPKTTVIQSESSSPVCKHHPFSMSQHSSPLRIFTSPAGSPSLPSSVLPPPGLELEGMCVPAETAHEASSSSNEHQHESITPPWRRLNENPWPNLSLFDRMPDPLQEPPRRIGRLLNPLWMRAPIVTSDETGGRPNLLSRIPHSRDPADVMHEIHDHDMNHDQLHHPFPQTHIHHLHGHGHGHGRYGMRLDANWGLYGQSGEVMKEVKTLIERFEELKKDVENLKTNGDGKERLDLVFSRMDELSNQLKDMTDENAKVSQQPLFTEGEELEALKNNVAALQNDLSILKAHKSAMQTDIRFLRVSHEELKSHVKDTSEKLTNDVATFATLTRRDAAALRGDIEGLRTGSDNIMHDLTPLKTNMSEVNSGIENIQTNIQSVNTSLTDVYGEIHALKGAHASAEQDLPSRIREQVRNEVRILIEQGGQLSPIIGKRKRSDDESLDAPVAGTSVPRPRKRLRMVIDIAAAGALGALGAWLGLAFL